jgi:hypothetical protein
MCSKRSSLCKRSNVWKPNCFGARLLHVHFSRLGISFSHPVQDRCNHRRAVPIVGWTLRVLLALSYTVEFGHHWPTPVLAANILWSWHCCVLATCQTTTCFRSIQLQPSRRWRYTRAHSNLVMTVSAICYHRHAKSWRIGRCRNLHHHRLHISRPNSDFERSSRRWWTDFVLSFTCCCQFPAQHKLNVVV